MKFSKLQKGADQEFVDKVSSTFGGLPSPHGTFVASLESNCLNFQDTTTHDVRTSISVSKSFSERVKFMGWSKLRSNITRGDNKTGPGRFLLADDKTVEIYDALDDTWNATVTQGHGAIKAVEFGKGVDEIVITSDFQLKITIWSLIDSGHVDLLHPKFMKKGHDRHPQTSHFALLSRPVTQDVLTIHDASSYKTLNTITVPTLDAQGLLWSPCGRWIAIWDSPTANHRLFIFTPDGNLFKTFEKPAEGLGIKTVVWSPTSDYLAVGCYDGKILFLNQFQFLPIIEMRHNPAIKKSKVDIWSEEVSGDGKHSCITIATEVHAIQSTQELTSQIDSSVPKPVELPTIRFNSDDKNNKIGVSLITFNCDGSLVATRDDGIPDTVWIWSLSLRQPIAVLVHLLPIKSIEWHPLVYNLLLIVCTPDTSSEEARDGVVYLWKSDWDTPRAYHTPIERASNGLYARWIPKINQEETDQPMFDNEHDTEGAEKGDIKSVKLVIGDKQGYVIGELKYQETDEEDEPDLDREGSPQGVYVDDGEGGLATYNTGMDVGMGVPEGPYV